VAEPAPESPSFSVRIGGEFACFTRPELKVERVSYEVITPSAARGVLEAILWKPAIRWEVRRIHVLRPVRWIGFKRNEVTRKLALVGVGKIMREGGTLEPLVADEEGHRAQRHTLALRDVEYVIEAGFRMVPGRAGPEDNPVKFAEMFSRRLEKGQCYRTPYLGCREFPAWFRPAREPFSAVDETRDLGLMLYDIQFGIKNRAHFFSARLERGVVAVAPPASWTGAGAAR
jgi:CRISPR-associated protein Cas5d